MSRSRGQALEFAVIARMTTGALKRALSVLVEDTGMYFLEDGDGHQVVAGTGEHCALVVWEPGSIGSEADIADWLSRETGAPAYALGLRGLDDPDDGLPFIARHQDGEQALIWMEEVDGLDDLELVPGPEGVPCDDPAAFASGLGVTLPRYRA